MIIPSFKAGIISFIRQIYVPAVPTDQLKLYMFGLNTSGQLGLADTTNRSSPVQVGTNTDWQEIAVGGSSTLARKTNSTLWSWGLNTSGQLGLADTTNRSSPVQVGNNSWTTCDTKYINSAAIRSDGTLWVWGQNSNGNLGLGYSSVAKSSPVQSGSGSSDWQSITIGNGMMTGLKTNGTIWSWGSGTLGRLGLGIGGFYIQYLPAQIGTDTNWSFVISSSAHSLGIKTNGTLWAWGSGNAGRTGVGDTINRSIPVQVGTDTNWSTASCGLHSVAIKTDGTLWAWGSNTYGQLGLGNTTNRSSPVQVGTDTNWESVSCDGSSTVAIKTNGTIWAWGRSNFGQLGLGNATNRSSPVQIGTGTQWDTVNNGVSHTGVILRIPV